MVVGFIGLSIAPILGALHSVMKKATWLR